MVSDRSAVSPLPNYTYEVKVMLEDHQKRVVRKDPYNPQSGVLPLDEDDAAAAGQDGMDVDEPDFVSLARCISEAAPQSFNVKFHITGTIPSVNEAQQGLGPLCRGEKYQFAVNVNDETAAIDALVANEAGEALFQREASEAAALSSSDTCALVKAVTDEDKLWKGTVKSFVLNGSKFFILETISAV